MIDFARLEDATYSEVIGELDRPDCNGLDYIEDLPDESETDQILSDTGSVRYFLYTKTHIFLLHIIDHDNEEDWDLIVLPR